VETVWLRIFSAHCNGKHMNQQPSCLPSVAVCLAAFNGKRWLPEQLNSILMQTGVILTIFVSVDCSTDGTEDWIDLAAKKDSRIVALRHGARFGGASRNFFRLIGTLDFSGFDYVSLADQDDIWLTDKLLCAHQIIIKTGADAYSSNVMAFWAEGRQLLIEKSQKQVAWDFLFEAAGPGCTYVIRKDLACAVQDVIKNRWNDMQQVGLHDWFVYAFARANGYRWVIDDYPGMLYRQHEKNQVGVNTGTRAFVQRARKVLSGWGVAQSALIAQLVGLGDDPFVKRWSDGSRSGLLWLALHAWQCRRRLRDKIIFALSCLALCIAGKRRL
jgi:rhamnosyltransferase